MARAESAQDNPSGKSRTADQGGKTSEKQAKPPKKILLEVGMEVRIRLQSNPTTGYSWEIAQPLDQNVVKLVSNEFEEPDDDLPGSAGAESWVFRAVGVGKTMIILNYSQPWRKGVKPAEVVRYYLEVR
jgi:inhibitor of cysteine peptidase